MFAGAGSMDAPTSLSGRLCETKRSNCLESMKLFEAGRSSSKNQSRAILIRRGRTKKLPAIARNSMSRRLPVETVLSHEAGRRQLALAACLLFAFRKRMRGIAPRLVVLFKIADFTVHRTRISSFGTHRLIMHIQPQDRITLQVRARPRPVPSARKA